MGSEMCIRDRRKLGLPAHLSPNAMLPVLSALYDRQTLLEEMRKL